MSDEQFENELKKVKFFDERKPGERYQWGIYCFVLDGEEMEIQVIVDYKEKKIHKNLLSITERLNAQHNLNEQSKRYGNGLEFTIRKLEKENEKLKELLNLIAEACTHTKQHSVKEILRHHLRGLDTVTGESAKAWHQYNLLNTFFKEQYKEIWDNFED